MSSDAIKLQESLEVQNGMPMKSSEDFSYLQQSQGYGMPHSDPYITSYYGGGGQIPFPYMGEWSAGDSVPYLQGYNSVPTTEPQVQHHQQPYMAENNMFATSNLGNGPQYFNQQALFPHGNEFTAWGAPPGGHNNVIEPGINQPNSYLDISYQQSLMHQSYLGGELLPPNSSGSTTNDLLGYGSTGNVSSGSDVTSKMPSENSQGISSLDQNFQNMKLDLTSSGDVEKLVANGDASSSLNIGITQNGISDNHDMVKIKPVNSEPAAPAKPISWAAIASKPAKPQPKPKTKVPNQGLPPPVKHGNVDIGTWDVSKSKENGTSSNHPQRWNSGQRQNGGRSYASEKHNGDYHDNYHSHKGKSNAANAPAPPVLEKLITQNEYNPDRLTVDLRSARFFVIKSYSEDDIHRSIKYNIWCSTEHGNKRLDSAFHDQTNRGPVLLLYSVNGSGHFCGVAEMKTAIDYGTTAGVWSQDKWKGSFQVKWIYVKDVPNSQLRHIRLENNDNKPVTNSRDTQEVPADKGRQVLSIIGNYKHQTSIFDDFGHYERKQLVEEDQKVKSAQRERKSDANNPHHSKTRK